MLFIVSHHKTRRDEWYDKIKFNDFRSGHFLIWFFLLLSGMGWRFFNLLIVNLRSTCTWIHGSSFSAIQVQATQFARIILETLVMGEGCWLFYLGIHNWFVFPLSWSYPGNLIGNNKSFLVASWLVQTIKEVNYCIWINTDGGSVQYRSTRELERAIARKLPNIG